jgi:hypothetical protein
MAPVLTTEQLAQLAADKAQKQSLITTMTNQIAGKEAQIAKYALSDSAFQVYFNYYNDDIIGQYETESKSINGYYIEEPINESDLEGTANVDGNSRTTPNMPETDIVRIAEFDGGPLVQDSNYEALRISYQEDLEDQLVNGFPFTGTLSLTTMTSTSVNGSSTSVELTDAASFEINVGDYFVVIGLGSVAVLKATAVVVTPPTEPPPMIPEPSTATITVEVIVVPVGTIASGAQVVAFTGFNNSERTAKIPSDLDFQNLMDYFILRLSEELNQRLDFMDAQLIALNVNQDPNTTQDDAIANIHLSKSFIEDYLLTMNISDSGLFDLSEEREARLEIMIERLIDIDELKSAHYDARYNMANNRANTARGTLRLQKATESSLQVTEDFIDDAQDQIDALDSIT